MTDQSIVDELVGIKEQIKELIEQASELIRGTSEEDRARAYWIPHLLMPLDDDHGYLGGCGATMQNAIDTLSEEVTS